MVCCRRSSNNGDVEDEDSFSSGGSRSRRLAALLALLFVAVFAIWRINVDFSIGGKTLIRHHYLLLQDRFKGAADADADQRFLLRGGFHVVPEQHHRLLDDTAAEK